jgi:hypothetical protein
MLSLIFCAAAVWWWVGRNPGSIDQLSFQPNSTNTLRFSASDGKVMFSRIVRDVPTSPGLKQLNWGTLPFDPSDKTLHQPAESWSGFAYTSAPVSAGSAPSFETTVLVPAWMLVGFFSLLPLIRVVTVLRRYKLAVAAA